MKKRVFSLSLILMLVCSLFAGLATVNDISFALSSGQGFIIATKANLYTAADFNSDKVITFDSEEQPVIVTLRLKDDITIHEIQEDFALVTTAKGVQGWVYKYYITQNEDQDVYPVFNGTVINDTTIYGTDKITPIQQTIKGTRVYLFEGFDKTSDFTAVQIALEDSSLVTGYISTKDIEPDGISKMLIVAITIIIAVVTIVLSLIFIKKKKKKKEKLTIKG